MSLQDKCSAILGKTRGEMMPRGLVTATKAKPKTRQITGNHKIPVSAKAARYIAERQIGGAIIFWLDMNCTIAEVYARD